jgi:hypothetical protein
VAGGVALTAAGSGVIAGCGGSDTTLATGDGGKGSDGGKGADAFPNEGFAVPDAFPQETGQQLDGFPQEGIDAAVYDSGKDAFPQEGPNIEAGFVDSSHADAGEDADAGFPSETASP